LVLALFLQPVVRSIKSQPYPAIFLPAGANVVRSDGPIRFRHRSYFAELAGGETVPFEIHDLLETVPPQYRGRVVENGFGLTVENVTPERVDASKRWLRERLRESLDGATAIAIIVRVEERVYDFRSDPIRHDFVEKERQRYELSPEGGME
jgi:hypothetical protein